MMWIGLTAGGSVAAVVFLRFLIRVWNRSQDLARRSQVEDALKHVHACHHGGTVASVESLAGRLHLSLSRAFDLVGRMEDQGLLESRGTGLQLTAAGTRLTLQVIRAHRLWERYLADEVGMAPGEIHRHADRREHRLTPNDANTLEVKLGHPRSDPHGDPIPSAEGDYESLGGTALCDWPVNRPGRIVHIEDEPEAAYSQITALGLKPGRIVEIIESSAHRMVITDGRDEFLLSPLVAANINVLGARRSMPGKEGSRLTDIRPGQSARVMGLADDCAGLTRRRFLDLGITPGASIRAGQAGPFGGLNSYFVRGSQIALRKGQADHIFVIPQTDGNGND